MRARPLLVLSLVTTSILPLVPASAGPVVVCAFEAETGALTVTPIEDTNIWRDGDAILVNEDTCGGATVTTVDTIEVVSSSSEWVQIWLATGEFSPGKTIEGNGSSEIEFTFTGVAASKVTISGTAAADHLAAGMTVAGDHPAINLNAGETTPDVDVTFATFPGILDVTLGEGNDAWSEAGIGDEADPLWVGAHVIVGGPGDDTIQPAFSDDPGPIFDGGGGMDVLSFAWMPAGCEVMAFQQVGDLLGDGCGTGSFTFGRFERFVGHAGLDWLGGDGGDDHILTRGGNDQLFATAGTDVLDGGTGRDIAVWIETGRVRADLRTGTAVVAGRWTQLLDGVEDLYGSPMADVLIGNARVNRLWGDAGDDRLLGMGGVDELDGGQGTDRCNSGPGGGESFTNCES